MSDLVDRLRAPANWLRQDKGEQWKDAVNRYDRAPFEAAARIERLETALEWIVGTALTEPEAMVEKARAALGEKP